MVSFLTQPLTIITKGKTMTDKQLEERLTRIESVLWPEGEQEGSVADAITGIIAIFQHLLNTVGDYMIESQVKREQLATNLAFVFETLNGGAAPDEQPPPDKPTLHVVEGNK